MSLEPVSNEGIKAVVAERVSDYLKLVAAAVKANPESIVWYNSEATIDPAKPNSQSGSLRFEIFGTEHDFVFSAWQWLLLSDPSLLKDTRIGQ